MIALIKKHCLPTVFLAFTTLTIGMTTLFSPYSTETFGHDAGIFAYIGYALNQGRVLYTGAWDNKGPLLYFINALGVLINHRYGIYLLEMIGLFVSLLFLYKTALLFLRPWSSVICSIFSVLPLTATLEGGNLSEEYALPFTIVAFYFIAKFFCNHFELKKYEMIVVGACIGGVFLLRLNILAFLFCAVLGVIVVLIKNREFKILGNTALFAAIGFVLCLLPFIIYLVANGAFKACIDTAYLGTLDAFSPLPAIQRIKNVGSMIIKMIPSGSFVLVVLFSIFFPFYAYTTRGKTSPLKCLCWISFLGLVLTLLANSLSGAGHMHYFMAFIPVLIIPAIWLSSFVEKYVEKHSPKSNSAAAILATIALVFCVSCVPQIYNNIFNNLRNGTDAYLNSKHRKVSGYLIENSAPTDTVQVMGDQSAVTSYYRARRLAASNYFYYANGRFSEESKYEFANKIFDDILSENPKLIIFTTQGKMDDYLGHLEDSEKWNEFLSTSYEVQENDFGCIIYMRRQ